MDEAAGKLGNMQVLCTYTARFEPPPVLADYILYCVLHIPHLPRLGENMCERIFGVHAASPRYHLFKSFSDRAWTAPAREHLVTMDGRLLTCS